MAKQLKKYLAIGLIVLAAILSLPAISILSNDDGLSTDAPSLIAQGLELPCDEMQQLALEEGDPKDDDQDGTQGDSGPGVDCDDGTAEGNSWGG